MACPQLSFCFPKLLLNIIGSSSVGMGFLFSQGMFKPNWFILTELGIIGAGEKSCSDRSHMPIDYGWHSMLKQSNKRAGEAVQEDMPFEDH